MIAATYGQGLLTQGHTVAHAPTAQMAIHAADRQTPDLVIVEVQLVEHSGVEFLYEFRSYPEWQQIPAIILSTVPPAEFSVSQELLKNELGVRSYYYKPQTKLAQLLTVVDELTAATV